MAAIQHVNRRGDTYYLQAKPSKKGVTRYSFTRKLTAAPVETLPDGFEIYEAPDNAQVFLRKIKPSQILAKERQLVENAVRTLAKLEHFLVDVDGDSLVIYLCDADVLDESEPSSSPFSMDAFMARTLREITIPRSRYSKMMRFSLDDAEARLFSAERWCFLGSIDDWFPLDYEKKLPKLIEKYVRHLGQESFYEKRFQNLYRDMGVPPMPCGFGVENIWKPRISNCYAARTGGTPVSRWRF